MDNMIHVLYADEAVALRTQVANYLTNKKEIKTIHVANDVIQLQQRMEAMPYDVLVIDLRLPGIRNMDFFDTLYKNYPDTTIIVITEMGFDVIVTNLLDKNVDYCMLKPFDLESLYQQILSLLRGKQDSNLYKPKIKRTERDRIGGILQELGISETNKGYLPLMVAVEIVQEDRSSINSITNKLYPRIAKACNTNNNKVERTIRQTIENSWKSGALQNMNPRYIPNSMHTKDKPSNAEFIAVVTDRLLLD